MREAKPHLPVVVRYQLADGSRCKKETPGAKKVRTRSDTYAVWLWIDGKRKRVSLKTTDLGEAWIRLRAIQRKAKDKERGITDDRSDHAAAPLDEHFAAWLQTVADGGADAKYVELLRSRTKELARLAKWTRLTGITADSCLSALAKLQRDEWKQRATKSDRTQRGRSAQTRNHYLRHIKQFTRWCVPARLLSDPLLNVRMINTEADRRHDRRAPTDVEVKALMDYLAGRGAKPPKVRYGMSGQQRAIGYKVSMATGFRAGEMRSLTRQSFDLEKGTVTCRAGYDKRRRKATVPLPPWLVEELAAWFAAAGGCWERFPARAPGRAVLKPDLKAAGIPWKIEGDDGPLFFDFHALRHYFVTWCVNQPDVPLKVLLTLTRHSTPTLALKTYGKIKRQSDVDDVIAKMPPPG